VLFACSLTWGLYLELLPDLPTDEFLGSLKQLIARRGKPNKIYSDNGKTLVAAANGAEAAGERGEVKVIKIFIEETFFLFAEVSDEPLVAEGKMLWDGVVGV